jgi:HEPN domain-containing protein
MAISVHPQDYYYAATERMAQANLLRRQQRYSIAMYIAGVAVECMLRAFYPKDRDFDKGHNIEALYKACDPEILGESAKKRLRGHIETVHLLWQNRYRYFSEERLRAHIRALGHDKRGVNPGADFLKVRCNELHDACNEVIMVGVRRFKCKLAE